MSLASAVVAAMVATASKLPSPLQVIVVAKPVSMFIAVGLFTLALLGSSNADVELSTAWETPPPVATTFSSYEDMQRYFDHRNQRRLRHIENPLQDSYIEAYNQYNEEEEISRTKRSAAGEQKQAKQQPALQKFEISDAVEPTDEVKELIRRYKSRELQQSERYLETVPPFNSKSSETVNKPKVKRTSPTNEVLGKQIFGKRLARTKRSTVYQQPANFKVRYIPFEITDAREPDAHTKNVIKRMRALEIERLSKEIPESNISSVEKLNPTDITTTTTKKPFTKRSKFTKSWKPRRTKRAAKAPEMIKFEISDAKNPDPSLKAFMKTKQTRETKDLKMGKTVANEATLSPDATTSTDQNTDDTKRYFVFKEAPKVKKSIHAAMPHDVQNIISHLIKGGGGGGGGSGGGKAYLKYIPAQQMDYNNLKAAYPIAKEGGYGGGVYGKYAHAVPVKFVYHPVVVGAVGGHAVDYAGGEQGGYGDGGKGGGGEGDGGPAAVAIPVKYVEVAGGEVGYGGAGGHGGNYVAAGGHTGNYVAAGGHAGNYVADGGHGGNYIAAGGHGGNYIGDGGHGANYVSVGGHGGNYVAAGGHGGNYVAAGGHGGNYVAAGGHSGGYGLVHGAGIGAHAGYAGYEGEHGGGAEGQAEGGDGNAGYIAAHAKAAIIHPIVVAEGGGGQAKGGGYGGGLAEIAAVKNVGNEVIKAIPAPQFKGETKYSVVPTVEQYAKTPTQDFQLKLYSPESLIAKAQLEAKDKAKAIVEEGQKAVAAAYKLAAEKGGAGFGGGYGGYGGNKGAEIGYGGSKAGSGQDGGGYGGYGGNKGAEIGYGGGKAGSGQDGGGYGGSKGAEIGYGGGKAGSGYEGGQGGAGPVIKIEYHAPAESFKGNYKDIPEFQQLSSLVGKSPEDQIHGLTYLLAKEMQNRLHLQRQQNYGGGGDEGSELGKGAGKGAGVAVYGGAGEGLEARPQDNKAPVLFHPEEPAALGGGAAAEGGKGYYQPIVGKYIGMAKSKQYIPVIEAAEELKGGGGLAANAAGAAGHAYGLSANYKGLGGYAGGVAVKAAGGGGGDDEVFNANSYAEAAAKLKSYASKYAFGYRIRDFSTGNDFGHKQNRDLHGVTRGQYHILLPDGRIQNVIYHADDTGFHADVSFESGR